METKTKTSVEPVSRVRQLGPYQSEKVARPIRLKLDANEGRNNMRFNFADDNALRTYPERTELEQLLAERFSVDPKQVIVTAGGDEAIDRVCRVYLEPGRNLIFPEPSFEMIRKYALMSGADVRTVDWQTGFPVDAILESADANTALVAVVSPNSPTGKTVELATLRRLANELPETLLLLDQAYAEFEETSSRRSLTEVALEEFPNVVIIRTFSKAWGLAGLRVGYALGPDELIDNLRRVGGPYPVSGPSLAIAIQCLKRMPDGQAEHLEQVARERESLRVRFSDSGCEIEPSQGNFVFVRFGNFRLDAQFVFDALANQGILVRRFLDQNALRITCPGNQADFDELQAVLDRILNPQAVLFDMDGVLVDEAPSYREAIRLTCLDYGLEVSLEEIARKKMEQNSNNDWEVTYRILTDSGRDVEYEAVKCCFEQIYQGDDQTSGIWDREVKLVDNAWLAKLSKRFPLAIVTGRPRKDAERFLQNENLTEYFRQVICLEDGPSKPASDNVLLAMKKLDVTSAWMIGDTPDDVTAAVQSGLVAIGTIAPQDDRNITTQRLVEAGATVIVNSLEQFGELLP